MVRVVFDALFEKRVRKLTDAALKERVKKQIARIIADPAAGKPMRFGRKGTREVHVPPFRLSYAREGDELIFLDFYHKDEQ